MSLTLTIYTDKIQDHIAWDWFRSMFKDVQFTKQLPGTPCTTALAIAMGDKARAIHTSAGPNDLGYVHKHLGVTVVATYDLVEVFSFKPTYEDDEWSDADEKDTTATQHKNKIFWLWCDVHKLISQSWITLTPTIHIQPSLKQVNEFLLDTTTPLVLDIETQPKSMTLNCIGLGDSRDLFVVPFYTYADNLAYPRTATMRFMANLSARTQKGLTVLHNSMYDLLFLAMFYRLPFGPNIYDTMVSHHAIYAQVEKSLGHAIRRWANARYHKDMGICHTHNSSQDLQLYRYNALDLQRTLEVYYAQQKFLTEEEPGFSGSVELLNSSIYPYALITLKGIAIDASKIGTSAHQLILKQKVLLRIIRILTGRADFNPNSGNQLKDYFFKYLCMEPVGRTETGAPKLGKKEIYRMAIKYPENPLWEVLLAYREVTTAIKFFEFQPPMPPWRGSMNIEETLTEIENKLQAIKIPNK